MNQWTSECECGRLLERAGARASVRARVYARADSLDGWADVSTAFRGQYDNECIIGERVNARASVLRAGVSRYVPLQLLYDDTTNE